MLLDIMMTGRYNNKNFTILEDGYSENEPVSGYALSKKRLPSVSLQAIP
jgi:hypothetical protein